MDNKIIKSEQNLIKHVENVLKLTNKLFLVDLRPLQIVHLDDHLLYGNGVGKCIKEKFPNAIIKNIVNGNDALDYVEYSIQNDITIDLIITDVAHPGLDGLDFCESVKKLEKKFSKSISFLFMTMHGGNEEFKIRMEALPSVKYLSKMISCEEIKLAVENLT